MDQCLLVIYSPPSLEEALVDRLLEADGVEGFSTCEAYGHGAGHAGLSLVEQVTGRQKRVQFSIGLSRDRADSLLEDLQACFRCSGLHYFILPVLETGRV